MSQKCQQRSFGRWSGRRESNAGPPACYRSSIENMGLSGELVGMRRREFITLLGGAAAWPLAARAQQADGVRRVGVLMGYAESDREGQALVAAFREGLQKLGWTEGGNIRIDTRWAALGAESMQRFAKDLVALQPDLIISPNTPPTAALLQQTRT